MDKASDFESEDCGFDPHRGQLLFYINTFAVEVLSKKARFFKEKTKF